jgi:FkbM family methyltransferase
MGLYTIFAAKAVGPRGAVIAIEPSSRDFARLKANVELNRIANLNLLQVAVSDYDREANLLLATDEHSGHNTLGGLMASLVTVTKRVTIGASKLFQRSVRSDDEHQSE